MSALQRDILLDDAEPGMVLAIALQDNSGGTLLPKGAELTEAVLQSLHRRGVERLTVVDAGLSAEEAARQKELATKRLAVLFRRAGGQAGSELLQRCLLRYRTGDA